jgi:hypothetical protein
MVAILALLRRVGDLSFTMSKRISKREATVNADLSSRVYQLSMNRRRSTRRALIMQRFPFLRMMLVLKTSTSTKTGG